MASTCMKNDEEPPLKLRKLEGEFDDSITVGMFCCSFNFKTFLGE